MQHLPSSESSSPLVSSLRMPFSFSSSPSFSRLLDRIGIALSGLCVVHCLVLPLLVPFLTTLAAFADSEWTHVILAALILPTVIFAAWRGYAKHGQSIVVYLLVSGLFAVLAALFAGEHFSNEPLEAGMTTLGSILLIAGHWQNHKHCKMCASGIPHKH